MKSMLKSLMSVAVAALAFTSCSNDATDEVIAKGELKTLEVNATIDQTRTTMLGDHVNLTWAEGDQIHLYIGKTATTAHDIDPNTGGKITGVTYNEKEDMVYAYYSTGSSASKNAQNVRLTIPAKQTQTKANVFAGENMPMAAKGSIANGKVKLAFQPLACVLVFNVYGSAQNENIKSIKFVASGCSGYDSKGCNLTVDPVKYTAYDQSSYATVELTTYAPVGTAKPDNTQLGENQVYLVVAPVSYPVGSKFIVTTDATQNNTYTFTTTTALDCSNTARVVNLNLKKSEELKPAIGVPDVPRQESAVNPNLMISPITFTNITNEQIAAAKVGVFSDEALTQPLENSWITIHDNNATLLPSGQLECTVAENTTTAERIAYIGIKCFEGTQVIAQAAIAITQLAPGAVVPDPTTAEVSKIVTSSTYKEYTTDDWIVTYGGGLSNGVASLGSSKDTNAGRCYLTNYPALADALGFSAPYNDSKDEKAAAIISQKALPAGYNTVTLEYNDVRAETQIAIAFSTDNGVTWAIIKESELGIDGAAGSATYEFPQQGAGRYAFVAISSADKSRITNCKITYSQK